MLRLLPNLNLLINQMIPLIYLDLLLDLLLESIK